MDEPSMNRAFIFRPNPENRSERALTGMPQLVIGQHERSHGLADRNGVTRVERRVFADGSRDFVRTKATETALHLMLTALQTAGTPD